VCPAKNGPGPAHGGDIEPVTCMMTVAAHEEIRHRAIVEDVAVEFANRIRGWRSNASGRLGLANDDVSGRWALMARRGHRARDGSRCGSWPPARRHGRRYRFVRWR